MDPSQLRIAPEKHRSMNESSAIPRLTVFHTTHDEAFRFAVGSGDAMTVISSVCVACFLSPGSFQCTASILQAAHDGVSS
jgi:hypothetical protein